ncbi:MAG: glucose-6-phosphate isomerase [Alphaproteobacteria bacterium HGW-Alphaproteobacteria-1]|jgi:glucose-6-phosphate isomerase|nr:MAG: glucose-6-phosphate isomerase [Alphaproteobacteria bacterium HGW-Alphaproteobacteria-1]
MWEKVKSEAEAARGRAILPLFDDPGRAESFSVRHDGMLFDYAKTTLTDSARAALLDLIRAQGLEARRGAMFAGQPINETEGRAVLHTALRDLGTGVLMLDGVDILQGIRATRTRMAEFARQIREDGWRDVVNIGIGGSHLGPEMAARALSPYHDGPRCHFVSNVDSADISDTLAGLDPTRTLVVIASKTFTTIETMTNAATARDWLISHGRDPGAHLAAVSSATERTAEWGIDPARVFGFGDYVGGRYSIWGPIGLPLMIAIGPERFTEFLQGAEAMDRHFRDAPLAANMPVMLALTGLWHRQALGFATRAVLPYDQRLARLPAYLQQLEMESNGKRVTLAGEATEMPTGPVVWGEPGTNGQHAFYQLIHQGTDVIPCEFLVAAIGHEPDLAHHHRLLVANCLAQSEALMRGRTPDEARALLAARGVTGADLDRQAAHRVFPGNRPSSTLIYDRLTPHRLGAIIALYEHRVFVEGVALGINSFDQWGVELGKDLALALAPLLDGADASVKDGSTRALLDFVRCTAG